MWGFTTGMEGTQVKDGWFSMKFQQTGENYVKDISYQKVECTYQKSTDTYILKLYYTDWGHGGASALMGTFTCVGGETSWTQVN